MSTSKIADLFLDAGEVRRRTSGANAPLRSVDFHALSRSMQERFAACARGEAAPQPIAVEPLRSRARLVFGSIALAGFAALTLFVARGFGQLHRAEALHRPNTLVVYVLCVGAVALGIAQLVVLRMRRRALPFVRGTYVFPVSVCDACDEVVRVFPLAEVSSIDRDPDEDATVRLVTGTGEVFRFRNATTGEARDLVIKLEVCRAEARALGGDAPRVTQMFTLDPLQAPRVSSPLGPRSPLARRMPSWSDRAWLVAPVIALAVAPGLRLLHNATSDALLFARARANHDVASYRAYVARGGRRADEVMAVHLPRAELAAARAVGTVEAIDEFRRTHPNSAIAREIEGARTVALLDALARAMKVGTVAAVQSFAQRYPDHGLEPELRASMHALFAPALEAYRRKPLARPEVRSFAERLFAWSERRAQTGATATTIQIRFRRRPSPTLRTADAMVSKHHWFIGEVSYPSRYFDQAHAMPRERAVGERVGKQVADAFGPTVFAVELGPRLDDGATPLPDVTEPTLFVTHEESWRGVFDGSITRPRGVWVDVAHHFDATFVIPGDDKPLTFELDAPEKIPQQVIHENPAGATIRAPLEEKLYGAMADAAFAKFEARFLEFVLPTAK